ncbi:MAG: DUF2808 domain-containing protein [Cyanothece sp. SIO1E1]|nr:DUF2808 domain-containing protein [Cyanothece sp. SIO1E1]
MDAGEPLEAVTIKQQENAQTVEFQANENEAFISDSFAGSPVLPLAAIGGVAAEPGEMTVVFEPPILPGNTVTVSVTPEQNPSVGGTYLFGITAYPAGLNSTGQFIGYDRLDIYDY